MPSPERPVKALLLGLRIVVFDREAARRIFSMGFYGKPFGIPKPKGADFDEPLELSLLEGVYLARKGVIDVYAPDGRKLEPDELYAMACERVPRFKELYRVYEEFRNRGYVVRSGLKFGCDFAVYEHGPGIDHAPYLIHVVPKGSSIDPTEIVRAGRLSHSVKKRFVVAIYDRARDDVTYIMFKWHKP